MGINLPHLLILLAIVLVLFGTKKLRNLGSDLGGAISGFKKAMKEEENTTAKDNKPALTESQMADVKAASKIDNSQT